MLKVRMGQQAFLVWLVMLIQLPWFIWLVFPVAGFAFRILCHWIGKTANVAVLFYLQVDYIIVSFHILAHPNDFVAVIARYSLFGTCYLKKTNDNTDNGINVVSPVLSTHFEVIALWWKNSFTPMLLGLLVVVK